MAIYKRGRAPLPRILPKINVAHFNEEPEVKVEKTPEQNAPQEQKKSPKKEDKAAESTL